MRFPMCCIDSVIDLQPFGRYAKARLFDPWFGSYGGDEGWGYVHPIAPDMITITTLEALAWSRGKIVTKNDVVNNVCNQDYTLVFI